MDECPNVLYFSFDEDLQEEIDRVASAYLKAFDELNELSFEKVFVDYNLWCAMLSDHNKFYPRIHSFSIKRGRSTNAALDVLKWRLEVLAHGKYLITSVLHHEPTFSRFGVTKLTIRRTQ